MKAKTIFFVIIMLTVSRLAYADWQIQFDAEAARVMYLGDNTLRGSFATRAEADAYQKSRPKFEQDHSWPVGYDRPNSGSGGYSGYSGGSQNMQTQMMQSILQSFFNKLFAPPGTLYQEEQVRQWVEQWKKEEEERRLAEKKRQEAAFANAQAGALNLLGNRPGAGAVASGDGVDTADGLEPGGTSFFGLGGGTGPGENPEPMNDPMVVDLRHLRCASYFAQAVETASTEDVPLLLDEALKTANGAPSSLGSVPPGAALPEIDDKGLLAFQQANIDYAKGHDFLLKCTENFKAIQQRRDLAYRTAEARRAELEKNMAGKTDEASLKKKQELLAEIHAALQAEDEAWLKAKVQLAVAEDQADKTREESTRILRALALGKDPASFHPPIASLPALKEETWLEMQNRMLEERRKLDEQTRKLQKELASFVPPLKSPERVHEGVILGTGTDAEDANNMEQDGVSCFNGKTYAAMNQAAEQARKQGKELGGAMVVSFGTPEQKKNPFDPFKYEKIEAGRVFWDHRTAGEASLATPQGQAAVERLAGKEFDRLVAHSNGASVAEALIRNDIITVNELNIVGGDRSLLNGHAYQQLLDSGKVKRVVVWVNVNDPVPGLTSVDQLKLAERSSDAAKHLAKKITGDLAGGDTRVEYRYMWGVDYRNTDKDLWYSIKAHYLESSYYPGIANELGVKYVLPKRVLNEK